MFASQMHAYLPARDESLRKKNSANRLHAKQRVDISVGMQIVWRDRMWEFLGPHGTRGPGLKGGDEKQ